MWGRWWTSWMVARGFPSPAVVEHHDPRLSFCHVAAALPPHVAGALCRLGEAAGVGDGVVAKVMKGPDVSLSSPAPSPLSSSCAAEADDVPDEHTPED
eukprot:gene45922-65717_t